MEVMFVALLIFLTLLVGLRLGRERNVSTFDLPHHFAARLDSIEASQRIMHEAIEATAAMHNAALRQHSGDPVRHSTIGLSRTSVHD